MDNGVAPCYTVFSRLRSSSGILESEKPVLIKAFIPELAIKAFNVGIVPWFTWADMFDEDLSFRGPLVKYPA